MRAERRSEERLPGLAQACSRSRTGRGPPPQLSAIRPPSIDAYPYCDRSVGVSASRGLVIEKLAIFLHCVPLACGSGSLGTAKSAGRLARTVASGSLSSGRIEVEVAERSLELPAASFCLGRRVLPGVSEALPQTFREISQLVFIHTQLFLKFGADLSALKLVFEAFQHQLGGLSFGFEIGGLRLNVIGDSALSLACTLTGAVATASCSVGR